MSRAIKKVCPERNASPPIRSMVASDAYRKGWESTFGKPTPTTTAKQDQNATVCSNLKR